MNELNTIPSTKPSTGFDLKPANLSEAMELASMISRSTLAPKSFSGRPEDTLVAMMMGTELGLNPMQAIQNIAVINGRPSIYGDAMLALVQAHPSFKSIDESFDEKTMTATCTVTRKGGSPHTQTYAQADAVKANLWGKQGPWVQHPKRMLSMRARGFALRNQFADALLGLISAEEAQDYPVDTNTGEIHRPVNSEVAQIGVDEFCSDEQFNKAFPTCEGKIKSGKKTNDEMIAFLDKKRKLTDKQKELLQAVEVDAPEGDK